MLVALALASADPVPPVPPAPDNDRWTWVRTLHTISDAQACRPNGTFAVALRWRLHHGVEKIVIRRHGKRLTSTETNKIASALSRATDVGYVQLSCANTRDAFVKIAYVDDALGHVEEMALEFMIRGDKLDLFPPVKRHWSR